MGEAERYSDYERPRKRITLGQDDNSLVALITINITFFILLLTIKVIYSYFDSDKALFFTQAVGYFDMPAQLSKLATRPWTVLTYMFTHVGNQNVLSGVFLLLGNMLWLWAFGFIFQELTGNKKLIPVYIYGGLAGALVFIITVNLIPSLKPTAGSALLEGGSASVMAVAVATTTLAPGYRLFRHLNGGIPIWILTLIYVAISFTGIAPKGNGYVLANVAGAGAGFLFIYLIRRGHDMSNWMNTFYSWCMNIFTPGKRKAQENIKEKVFYNSEGRKPFKKTANVTQQRVDEILDKINQKGYHFLTEEEKNILKRASEEDL